MSTFGNIETAELKDKAVTPQEIGKDVRNETGGTLTAGTLVALGGFNASKGRRLIVKADANAARKKAVWILTADLANNTNGRVGKFFHLKGTATSNVDTSAGAVGDPVYLSATAGGWTLADPFVAATANSQSVGAVTVVSATVGEIDFDLTDDNTKLSGLDAAAIPAGAAGGDLGGTYPNPTVAQSSTAFALTGDISPAAFAAAQHDYNPASLATASTLRLTSTGAQDITGIVGGADGRVLVIHNIGAANITLKDADALSTAANRFALASDVILAPDDGCVLQYDSTTSRWRSVASSASLGGAAGDLAGNYPNPTVKQSSTAFALTGDISPAAIAAQADNYDPASLATSSVLRIELTGAQSMTGLAGGADGRLIVIHNIDATDALTLVDASVASLAANRFALQGNVVLAPDTSVLLQYDSTASLWRMVGGVLPAGALTADAAGRALVAGDFFDLATALAKFGTDSLDNAFYLKAMKNGEFLADDATRALFAAEFLGLTATGRALMADGFVDPAAMSVEVWNDTGVAMAANDLVYISGYNVANTKPTIAGADSDAAGKRAQYVCIGAIADGAAGRVYKTFTSAADQNTAAAGAAGDPIYLSTVAKGYVIAAPAAGIRKQIVGHVKVKDAAVGVVVFNTESTNDELFGTTELAAAAVINTKMPAGVISADATGRALMAANVFDVATALDKFAADSLANAFLIQAIANGAFAADDTTRALFAAGFLGATATGRGLMQTGYFTEAKATDAFDAQAITGALIKNLTITNGLLAVGILSADATGRALIADDMLTSVEVSSSGAGGKFAANAISTAGIIHLVADDAFTSSEVSASGAGGKFAANAISEAGLVHLVADDAFDKTVTDAKFSAMALGPQKLYTKEPFASFPKLSKSDGYTAPTGVTGDLNLCVTELNSFEYKVLGAGQTILGPTFGAAGYDVAQDLTADEGAEYTQGITSRCKNAFVIGTSGDFYAKLKFKIADVSGTDDCAFGFRKAEAYQAAIDNYNDMAVLNVIAGDIKIETIAAGGATTTTDTTDNWLDGASHTLEIYVTTAGVVTYLIDDVAPTVTAAFSFTAADVVVPFFYFLHDAVAPGAITLESWEVGLQ